MTTTEVKASNPDKMPWGRFLAWKTRDIALAAVTVIINGYLLLYCSNQLGLDTRIVGTMILAARIIDAFTDVIAGYMVDNTSTRFGKARPYEFAIVLEWLCMILLFFANETWSIGLKYAYVFILYVLIYSIFNTMLNAAQTPYMVRAFNGNRKVITKVSSFGGIVSMAGSIAVSMTFPRFYNAWVVNGQGGAAAWHRLILMYAIPLALFGMIRFFCVKEDPSIDAGKSQKLDFKEALTMMKTNPYAWSFGGMIGLYQLAVGFGAGSFYFQYIVGDAGKFGIVSALAIILLPLMIIFPTLIKKLGLSKLFIVFAIISIVGYVMVFLAGSNLAMVFAGIIITNLISLPCAYLQVPGIMDVATYNEYMGLHRMEGSSSVVMNFLSKALNGLGTGLTGVFLGFAGFISSTGGAAVTQPGSALLMIRLLYSLIPALAIVGVALCAVHFSKLEKRMPEITAELKARKEAQAQ